MPRAKKTSGSTPIEATVHQDKRANIPTSELRDFVVAEETTPSELRYPRDPSLDPQLVWKGKDEQDGSDLVIKAPPIYIQEKIDSRVLVENLRKTASENQPEPEMTLFESFDGLEFSELVDFYQHEANWSNRMILGDSLAVMASLAEKEGLRGKVQCIYIDPPYGIRFGSNWQVSTRKRDVKDGRAEDLVRQPEQVKAFRDTWELGIHSYLSYLRDRFFVARDLLTETGSIFVQIGDENVHLVRGIMDEVFGSENYLATIPFRTSAGLGSAKLKKTSDYLLWYAKGAGQVKFRRLFTKKTWGEDSMFTSIELSDGSRRQMSDQERRGAALPANARPFRFSDLVSSGLTESCVFEFEFEGQNFSPGRSRSWKTTQAGMSKLANAQRLSAPGSTLQYLTFFEDFPVSELTEIWADTVGELSKVFVVQTATKIIERCLLMTTDPGDLVLDPTCGSGTTAFVAEQWGRRWITIDTSRVALALARTRLMSAKYPYYLLADTSEGVTKESELSGISIAANGQSADVRKGFVYKSVPHVTLKSIAQNPDIYEGMSQAQIAAAITKHADKELLYDQPYEDKNRIRVTGPFTVESLSPHRVLEETDDVPPTSEKDTKKDESELHFIGTILENLRKAGVQNTVRDERLVFDRLEMYPGEWINASGEFVDSEGNTKSVAVSLGPEHGTVGPIQVKEAAKEAVRGLGFDVLVVCGFAFDAAVPEVAREFGNLVVLPARMNPDLAMGDEVLKKTGTGNLFTVFGEPDLTVKEENGMVTVELRGVDVYDPTTGQIRSNSTDDVACWFIDSDYNGESFFVRHAYFTGGDQPYEKLKRALKAEIDEATWSSLYSTVSRPFDKPDNGKIAVKVINHYGDEIMQVYSVA